MFNKQCLFSIANITGTPMTIDMPIADLSYPSVTQVYVEVSVLKKIPSRIWLERGDIPKFWQEVEVEKIPSYCKLYKNWGMILTHAEWVNPNNKNFKSPKCKDIKEKKSEILKSKWRIIPQMKGKMLLRPIQRSEYKPLIPNPHQYGVKSKEKC